MLGRQVKILLAARSLLDENPRASKQDLASEMDVHPFVAQKAMQQAVGFKYKRLKEVHKLLYEFDFKIKTGQIKPDLAVDLLTDKLIK
jgi:DNA polymerase-3 subunit delta